MKDKKIKCKVRIDKVFFPKTGKIEAGSWAAFSCEVLATIEGEPQINRKFNTISCSGKNIPSISKDEIYILTAIGVESEERGLQYQIVDMHTEYKLDNPIDQKVFLKRILTEKEIEALYKGVSNPFDLIAKKDLHGLTMIKGIGPYKAQRMVTKYEENIDNSELYLLLEKYGLTKNAMDKLKALFGLGVLAEKLEEDPYFLLYQVKGYGWSKADKVAMNSGISATDVRRVRAFITYTLNSRAEEGHTYIETSQLLDLIREQLSNVPDGVIRDSLYSLSEEQIIWWDETKTKIGAVENYILEENIAKELLRLQEAGNTMRYRPLDKVLPSIETKNGWEFTDEQRQAVENTLKANVSIITGSAGTGKSTVVSAILQCCIGATFAQTALAGRAAARLSEITGESGYTIHRLLGYGQGTKETGSIFLYNQNNKLPYDLIIVDEISMVGGEIFYSLIRAIENGTKLIMLGDVSQLESIGYLNLFRDMMDSGVIVTSHLNKIHRQAAKSAIITSSMHVRNQMQLFPKNYSGQKVMGDLQDLEVDIYEDSIITQRKIVKHYTTLLEKGIHKNDIQVIVPMKTRGDISTFALNPLLQKVANPNLFDYIVRKKRVGSNDVEYKIGVNDRVINVSNHYDTFNLDGDTVPVYNGNMGIVVQISEEEAVVDFYQWGKIVIPKTYFNDLELAYAITGHKLQGSESPYTIIGLDMSAYMMLTKEWLYTAITRARKYCVLCAQNAAVSMAINTSRVPYKQTLLKQMLNGKSYFDTKKITKVQERIIESENSNWL